MGKFAIAKDSTKPESTIDSEITKAGATASPFIRALAAKLMSKYNPPVEAGLSKAQQAVQGVINKHGNTPYVNALIDLTEVITGFRPKVPTSPAITVGSMFKYDNKPYVVVYINSSTAYGINATGNAYATISNATNISAIAPSGGCYVSLPEAGLFAKELLSTNGLSFITYVSSVISGIAGVQLLKDLGVDNI